MLSLIPANPVPFIIALIIGLATAWWIWGRVSGTEAEAETDIGMDGDQDGTAEYSAPAATAATAAAVSAAAPQPEPVQPPKPLAVAELDDPKPVAKKPKIAAAVGDPDDLKRVKGIGPKLEKLCNSLGVKRWDQIAAWTAADIKEVDGHLGSFTGRIERDEWVAQAKLLAAGDFDGHVRQYGK